LGGVTPGAAAAFDSSSFNPAAYAQNVAGSAAIGCASTVASGGSCGSGALAGAVGSALSPITSTVFPNAKTDFGQRAGATIVQATVGGLASVAGGGKFANGAVTGAFQYLATTSLEDARRDTRMDAYDVDPSEFGSISGRVFGKFFGVVGEMLFSSTSVANDGRANVANEIGILRDAATGKGDFGLGAATPWDSDRLGEAWVGPNYRVTSDGYLESVDQLRLYRQPDYKPSLGRWQSNFMSRWEPRGEWQNNGHLDIMRY
jgi:hypothetical protein